MNENTILKNDRLKISVANCPFFSYNSSRFDWTGFVPEILFDEKYSMCSVESLNPTDPMANGAGLCNEFRVPHYAAKTPAGEKFLKPGIGLLTQKEGSQEWKFNHRYKIDPFHIIQTHGKDWIMYQTEGALWDDILINEHKLLRLIGTSIVETITIDNLGMKPFQCVDYNHNFLAINHEPFGPSYRIDVPCFTEECLEKSITAGNLIVKDREYTWNGPCEKEVRTMTREGRITSDSYVWGMYNDDLGVGIREYLDIPFEEFCIWATDYVCTCKVLAPIEISPKSSKTWTRRWECVYI